LPISSTASGFMLLRAAEIGDGPSLLDRLQADFALKRGLSKSVVAQFHP